MKTQNRIKKIDFELSAPTAKSVLLTGSFCAWKSDGLSMKKDKRGIWKTSLELAPGQYEYKYIVDGNWWTDPTNTNLIRNSLGTLNSVKDIGA